MTQHTLSTDNKALIRQQFGANAVAYATSAIHAKGWSLNRLVEITQPNPAWHVLDVATGAGHTAFTFAPHVAHVVASDLTPQMLEVAEGLAQEKGLENIRFKQADAENLPFDDSTFDLITCRIAPHHFPDIARFVRECARILKPGGALAIVDNIVSADPIAADFVNAFEKYRDPSHNRCLSAEEWAGAFAQAGVTLTHTEAAHKYVDFGGWAANQNVPPDRQEKLREMLRNASAPALEFLTPKYADNGAITFRLTEAILVGRNRSPPYYQ
ncbi:MAG: methyltransferase domain-containing protein [Anaerolineales bacterium]